MRSDQLDDHRPVADWTDRYDPAIAEMVMTTSAFAQGLPDYLGLELVAFGPGTLRCQADLAQQLTTPSGNVHGGCLASILDHITGAVIYPLMPRGCWGATTELKLNYIRAVKAGRVHAEASVLAMTNRTAVVRGELYADDRLACAAQGTIAVVRPKSTE